MKTISINEAAGQFDTLMELALQGEPILIETGSKLLLLHEVPSLPVAPAGFFDDIYDEDYVREAQLLEGHSVISPDP